MTRIGVLSDTHGLLDERVLEHFKNVDQIWHAGDIGSMEVLQTLQNFKPVHAVRGNADAGDVRYSLRDIEAFRVENVNVLLTQIGYQNGYLTPAVRNIVAREPVQLFACGHSHILKVTYDKHYRMLCMNPGAAGKYGFHTVQTLLRFVIDDTQIRDLEVIELQRH